MGQEDIYQGIESHRHFLLTLHYVGKDDDQSGGIGDPAENIERFHNRKEKAQESSQENEQDESARNEIAETEGRFRKPLGEESSVNPIAGNLIEVPQYSRAAVMEDDHARIIEDFASLFELADDVETEFRVFSRPIVAVESADRLEDVFPDGKIDARPVGNEMLFPDRSIALGKSAGKMAEKDRAGDFLEKAVVFGRDSRSADRSDRRVGKIAVQDIQDILLGIGIVIDENQDLAMGIVHRHASFGSWSLRAFDLPGLGPFLLAFEALVDIDDYLIIFPFYFQDLRNRFSNIGIYLIDRDYEAVVYFVPHFVFLECLFSFFYFGFPYDIHGTVVDLRMDIGNI